MSDREQQPDALEVSAGAAEAAPAQPAAEAAVADPNARPRVWYVIHTYSGYENKVKKALEQRLADAGMQQEIFKVVVPTEEEVEIKDGHRRTVERRVFPAMCSSRCCSSRKAISTPTKPGT